MNLKTFFTLLLCIFLGVVLALAAVGLIAKTFLAQQIQDATNKNPVLKFLGL